MLGISIYPYIPIERTVLVLQVLVGETRHCNFSVMPITPVYQIIAIIMSPGDILSVITTSTSCTVGCTGGISIYTITPERQVTSSYKLVGILYAIRKASISIYSYITPSQVKI